MGPTMAIGTALAAYLQGLVYTSETKSASDPLFGQPIFAVTQLEEIKNVQKVTSAGKAACEVLGYRDETRTPTFAGGPQGGTRWRTQSWIILSMVGIDTSAQAAMIYDISDELVAKLSKKVKLDNQVTGLFWAHFKSPESGMFLRIDRNGQDVQAHMIELITEVTETVVLTG